MIVTRRSGELIFLILFTFLIIFVFSIGQRYLQWGIDATSILRFEIISCFSIGTMLFSFRRSNPITPYFLYSFFILLLGYSFIPLNQYNENLASYDFILLVLTVFFFLSGIYCGEKIHLNIIPIPIPVCYRLMIFGGVAILSVLIFLLECVKLGFIPLTKMLSMNVYHAMNDNAIPVLHYFTQSAYIVPIWACLLCKENFLTKKKRNVIIALALFVVFNSLSRQMWLLLLIGIGLYYMYYHVVSRRKLLMFMAIAVGMFMVIGAIRLFTTISDNRSNTEYLQAYAGTQYETNLIETYIALYSTNNFTTFKNYVQKSDKQDYRGYGVYTLRPIYTITLLNRMSDFDINPTYDAFSALGTYAIDPYLDFGIYGVVFLNFLYGFILAFAYKKYERKNYRWIVPWAVLAFCVLMAAFTNFFNTFFVWFILMLNFLILPPCINDAK
jgi:oligosaccharide repeat unit polymerase